MSDMENAVVSTDAASGAAADTGTQASGGVQTSTGVRTGLYIGGEERFTDEVHACCRHAPDTEEDQ